MSRPLPPTPDHIEIAKSYYENNQIEKSKKALRSAQKQVVLDTLIALGLILLGGLTLKGSSIGWPIALLCLGGCALLVIIHRCFQIRYLQEKIKRF